METNPVSFLVCVGEEFYKLHEVVDEYSRLGVSKKIPLTAIPDGAVKGVSKILVAHPKAIVRVQNIDEDFFSLAYRLWVEGLLTTDAYDEILLYDGASYWEDDVLQPEDFVPTPMLYVTYALSQLSSEQPGVFEDIQSTFRLQYQMGVIGYSPFSGFQVVLSDDEEDLPEELEELRPLVELGLLEPVHVLYVDATETDTEEE